MMAFCDILRDGKSKPITAVMGAGFVYPVETTKDIFQIFFRNGQPRIGYAKRTVFGTCAGETQCHIGTRGGVF